MNRRSLWAGGMEALETRRLLSTLTADPAAPPDHAPEGGPLQVEEWQGPDGLQLFVTGTGLKDRIRLSQSADGLLLTNAGGYKLLLDRQYVKIRINAGYGDDSVVADPSVTTPLVIEGGLGNDNLVGGSGDDTIVGGPGRNRLSGAFGNDTLVSLGGSKGDILKGGFGDDRFWSDAAGDKVSDLSPQERGEGAVHAVGSFRAYRMPDGGILNQWMNAPMQVMGQDLPDPVLADGWSYAPTYGAPLFATGGPKLQDVQQGYVGDCYFLATIGAVAKADPNFIRNHVADLGDGTYAVQFQRAGKPVYVRVDGDMPMLEGDLAAGAAPADEDAVWVGVMEKAYAYFRDGDGTYASIEGGFPSEVFADLGFVPTPAALSAESDLLTMALQDQNAGRVAVFGTGDVPAGSPLIEFHAYTVDQVLVDDTGTPYALRLRNPWGSDGGEKDTDGVDDGYITVTAAEAFAAANPAEAYTSAAV